jgi:hypothetical protein
MLTDSSEEKAKAELWVALTALVKSVTNVVDKFGEQLDRDLKNQQRKR